MAPPLGRSVFRHGLRLPFDATHECRPPRALLAECEPLVRSVHPARAKERRYQAGFLTSRIVALVAAFSRAEAPNGILAMRSPVTVAGAVPGSADQAAVPNFPIKPFRAPNTRRRDRQSRAAPQAASFQALPLASHSPAL